MSAIPFGPEMQLEDDSVLLALDDPDDARARASLRVVAALAALAPHAVTPIADALAARVFSPGPWARRAALADALAMLTLPDTATLLWHLDGEDHACRALAARALASPRHAKSGAALEARLSDEREDELVREACAAALAGQGAATSAGALAAAAMSQSARVRRACADGLAKVPPSRRGGAALAALAADADAAVHVSALSALVVVGGAGARRAALAALACADAPSIAAALLVLARHGQPADAAHARQHEGAADARVRRAARSCVEELAC